MQIALYFGSIISSYFLRKREQKTIALIFYVCIFFFILNSALNIPDAENYNIFYSYLLQFSTSPLYTLIQMPFVKFGVSFPVFKAIIYCAFFYFVSVNLRKIDIDVYYVFFLMLLSVFFTNAIQIRNFCAMCVLTVGITYLLRGGIRNKIVYLISVTIASLFHSSFIVYAAFLIPLPKRTRYRKILIGSYFAIFIGAYAILMFNKNILLNFFLLFGSFEREKIDFYTSTVTNLGPWIVLIGQIYTIVMFYFCYKRVEHLELAATDILEKTIFFNILAIPFCGLALFNLNFYRLIRNIVLINLGVLTIFWRNTRRTTGISYVLSFWYTILWFVIDAILLQSFNQIITPFFG